MTMVAVVKPIPPIGPWVDRFWANVDKGSDSEEDCWFWQAYCDPKGYGRFTICFGQTYAAHIVAYQLLNGPYPEGMETDHLCRVRACVNPSHLEPVTHAENQRRMALAMTHCKKGHEFTPENTKVDNTGRRRCRTCDRARKQYVPHPRPEVTHCPQGHEYTPENTYVNPVGGRVCRTCRRVTGRLYQRQRRAALKAGSQAEPIISPPWKEPR